MTTLHDYVQAAFDYWNTRRQFIFITLTSNQAEYAGGRHGPVCTYAEGGLYGDTGTDPTSFLGGELRQYVGDHLHLSGGVSAPFDPARTGVLWARLRITGPGPSDVVVRFAPDAGADFEQTSWPLTNLRLAHGIVVGEGLGSGPGAPRAVYLMSLWLGRA